MSYIAQSRGQVVFVSDEATYGTQAKPVTGDALKVLSCNLNWTVERRERMDKSAFRSQQAQLDGRTSASWDLERYLCTAGTLGATAQPDDKELWLAALGTLSGTATHSRFFPDTDGAGNWDEKGFTIYSRVDAGGNTVKGDAMESVWGAVVDTVEITFSGSEEAKVKFSGPAKAGVFTGNTTLATALASQATTFTAGEARFLDVGSLIQIGTNVSVGTGYLVTAVDAASKTIITIDAACATQGADTLVYPFLPAETVTAETPIFGSKGSVTLGGVTFQATEGSITIEEGRELINDEHGTSSANAVVNPGKRKVAFSVTGYMHREVASAIYRANTSASTAVTIDIGSTSTEIVRVLMPQSEIDVTTLDVGGTDEVMLTLTGKAVHATGDDDINVLFL